jgi:phospholipid/cholesterol/gamma-HCH transport system substrate-binding protein
LSKQLHFEINERNKAAILVIASILLFIWDIVFKRKRPFTSYVTLYAEYETVEGLTTSVLVTLNGLVIEVNNITIVESSGKYS